MRGFTVLRNRKIMGMGIFILVLALNPLKGNPTAAGLRRIRATCYCEPGITYSGHYTHEGIVAGRNIDIGDVAAIYAVAEDGGVGEFIGYFEVLDCGAGFDTDGDGKGDSTIKGKTIDVFRNNIDGVKSWIKRYGDYVYIKLIEAEG